MKYEARCYIDHIDYLQKIMDEAVKMHPHIKGIVPKFEHRRNDIGPSLVNGKPLHDPYIAIIWDDGRDSDE